MFLHAVGAQCVEQRHSNLQGAVAEDVLDHPVEKAGFPLSDNLSRRRLKKGKRVFGLHVVSLKKIPDHRKDGASRTLTP